MKYIMVKWIQKAPNEPVLLYSELDDHMSELRKIEVYTDGHADFADREKRSGNTKLGIEPFPPLEEITADPEFEPQLISAEEFETLWDKLRNK